MIELRFAVRCRGLMSRRLLDYFRPLIDASAYCHFAFAAADA